MIKKSVSVMLFVSFYCALVNCVSAKTVPPSQIEPLPDMYAFASTYPGMNNAVNYNASPNPQYPSNNFNNFNEPTQPPPPQMLGNYQKPLQQQTSLEELVMGNAPTTKAYDYSNDLKNTLTSMKDNLGLMTETQRLLLNSFKVQQQQYNNIEEKLQINDNPSPRNAAYGGQQNYGAPATQQPQYQSIAPLPLLPYGQTTNQVHEVQHHKKHTQKKGFGKMLRKFRRGNRRGLARLASLQRRSEAVRMERHAAMTLNYIKNGVINALWTALVVACVKLAPILLFGFKLMFKSVLPLTGLALFGANRGIFPQHFQEKNNDDDIRFDDEDDEDDEDEDLSDDEDRDISEEREEHGHGHHY